MGGPFFSGLLSLDGVVPEDCFERSLQVLALEKHKVTILAKRKSKSHRVNKLINK